MYIPRFPLADLSTIARELAPRGPSTRQVMFRNARANVNTGVKTKTKTNALVEPRAGSSPRGGAGGSPR